MPPTIETRAERLLAALAGVVSARAVSDELGRLCEIHILAAPELHPKQIVRNVESALSAGLGVIVDRRIVSVAQLRGGAAEPYMETHRKFTRDAESRAARLVYVQYDASSTSALDARWVASRSLPYSAVLCRILSYSAPIHGQSRFCRSRTPR